MNECNRIRDGKLDPGLNVPRAGPNHLRPRLGRRYPLWNSALVATAAAIAIFWWIGNRFPNGPRRDGYSPPAASSPEPSRISINNNRSAGRKLAVDLDGTVAVYPDEVDRLVAPSGRFRIDLSVEHIAAILNINGRMIARTSNSNDLDSEAVLFVVAVGRLTAQARLRSAAERLRQARDGVPADYAVDEWTTQELRFTLRTLSHPSSREQAILEAISRSARECMPEPGEKIRAIPATRREIESGAVDFSPGYLPLEQAVANTRQGR